MGTKVSNGISVELTAEEQTAHETAQATAQAAIQAEKDAKATIDANKASGNQKLKDLGLDDDEIKALTGA